MLLSGSSLQVLVANGPIDLRAGHDRLVAYVQQAWQRDPFSGQLFVFYGRRKDRIKILFFDRGGFVLYYKRLEAGRFAFSTCTHGEAYATIDRVALHMLLDGIDLRQVPRPRGWRPGICTEALAATGAGQGR